MPESNLSQWLQMNEKEDDIEWWVCWMKHVIKEIDTTLAV